MQPLLQKKSCYVFGLHTVCACVALVIRGLSAPPYFHVALVIRGLSAPPYFRVALVIRGLPAPPYFSTLSHKRNHFRKIGY
jgi:hypothetical protein